MPPLSSTIPQHPYDSQSEEQKGEGVSDNVAQQSGLIIYGAAVNSDHTNAYEALAEAAVFCSPEKEEGMNAFFAKRPPRFHREEDEG